MKRWCKKFDDLLRTKAQKREFRHYKGMIIGRKSAKKSISNRERLGRSHIPQITPLS
ncbi:conserved hypothetical protein [Hyella patelloides LEGE 07179]|uniref:Uncharacterized protein n=1 Tax=Hyella patelloides LEGE 07179 TaxID=945734 RepID=A0A563VXB5_9CYAN|nr:conserved hypothetical protein [Hyella patelloides LEGE 07179]